MDSLHQQTKEKAFSQGKRDARSGKHYNSKSKEGSMWDTEYSKGFNQISECGCRFERHDSSAVILCEKCSALPCFNK